MMTRGLSSALCGAALLLALAGCKSDPPPQPKEPEAPVQAPDTSQEDARAEYDAGVEAEARGDYAQAREAYIQAQSFVAGFEVRVLLSEILEHFGDRLRPADADAPDFAMRGNILVPEGGLLVRQDEVRET